MVETSSNVVASCVNAVSEAFIPTARARVLKYRTRSPNRPIPISTKMALVNGSVPRWVADLQSPPAAKSKVSGISDPPGYPSQSTGSKKQKDQKVQPQPRKQQSPEEMDTLKVKKAWEVALAPVKNLPMTAIMMYMSGNSLQIFSIMMVFMAFKNPLVGLTAVNQAFERFESETNKGKMLQVKLAYVAMQFVALGLAVWKVNSMGLLPTTRSDWLAWEVRREPLEFSVPAL
ncbi:ER membrane protein complex subunit 4 [Colletotrichum gloeosporioides]|uniref:ER membrane protein complex subunit 4 n=4 Tax=Colletotrichum gloeosporioides species complex TaxID=2707338 RepID=A0A8H4CG91_COLGL|nr:ER membrane protein complex subunit 4 [Colletotrichum gloeosporioides]KAF3803291.1 ER membrane protein complex subunit 4 [Colletotrichum gloeosporioides]